MERKVYLGGSLFDARHIAGNALLAEAIEEASRGRYGVVAPQDIELPAMDAKSIRDTDYRAVLACDVAVFLFDGAELDSGVVAELMAAKFADIPSVLLRTDFRRSGDRNIRPWNLMCDFFPRTETLVLDSMELYSKQRYEGKSSSLDAARAAIKLIAERLVQKMDAVVASEPLVQDREELLAWVEKALDLPIVD